MFLNKVNQVHGMRVWISVSCSHQYLFTNIVSLYKFDSAVLQNKGQFHIIVVKKTCTIVFDKTLSCS